jgi:hypothetical protein
VTGLITWVETKSMRLHGRLRPAYIDDERFDRAQWTGPADVGPPAYQWRSYLRGGEEIARSLLCLKYPSHSLDSSKSARMLWNLEVRDDIRGSRDHLGSAIVEQLIRERPDQEMYIGPTAESITFWQRFEWPMCSCPDCDGRGFIVRRP